MRFKNIFNNFLLRVLDSICGPLPVLPATLYMAFVITPVPMADSSLPASDVSPSACPCPLPAHHFLPPWPTNVGGWLYQCPWLELNHCLQPTFGHTIGGSCKYWVKIFGTPIWEIFFQHFLGANPAWQFVRALVSAAFRWPPWWHQCQQLTLRYQHLTSLQLPACLQPRSLI